MALKIGHRGTVSANLNNLANEYVTEQAVLAGKKCHCPFIFPYLFQWKEFTSMLFLIKGILQRENS